MSRKVGTKKVLEFMNIKYASLRKLMIEHPKPDVFDSNSMRGRRFPKGQKKGRELLFEVDGVRQWCSDNAEYYRQRKPSTVTIRIPIDRFLEFLELYRRKPTGTAVFNEHLDKIEIDKRDQYLLFNSAKVDGNDMILEFDDPDEAVWFKLKYT